MNIALDEIRKQAPEGATHYMLSTLYLGDGDTITYFKHDGERYFEYFAHHFARYETGVCHSLIKPLN